MTNDSLHIPVLIIGGGPAGAATSLTLTARGVAHALADAHEHEMDQSETAHGAKRNARQNGVTKPGEAIPPEARPLFRQLGLEVLLHDFAHQPYYGNHTRWGSQTPQDLEFIHGIHGHGYLLHRTRFENQLREQVTRTDCIFLGGYSLKQLQRTPQGIQAHLHNGTRYIQVQARFIVDATGRKASVCRQLGVHKIQPDEQFALMARAQVSDSMPQCIHIEAVEHGWWYMAPLTNGEASLMFFTQPDLIPAKEQLPRFFTEHLNHCAPDFTQNIIPHTQSIRILPAGSSHLPIPYGADWLAVGDAAYAYDPISSFGITSALAGGMYGAHALADTLAGQTDALPVYRYLMENAYQAYRHKLATHYALETRWPQSSYWQNRLKQI